MLSMNKDTNENLKDIDSSLSNPSLNKWEDQSKGLSFTKTNKLITALYMVTDIIDQEEPIRHKLRTLGVEIISDTSTLPKAGFDMGKIDQIVSFLSIASAMNFISEMNCNILKKEFLELRSSLQGYINIKPAWLEKFLFEQSLLDREEEGGNLLTTISSFERSSTLRKKNSKGHGNHIKGHTRIGVQKGSTLLKALSDKTHHFVSDNNFTKMNKNNPASHETESLHAGFDILKKERRFEIINVIRKRGGGVTITDIRTDEIMQGETLRNISEKTLQRELISMTKDGVLNKTGEKRWTRYFIK